MAAESGTPHVNPAATRKADAERTRIQWRARILALPGGPFWLSAFCAARKWKEQACFDATLP